MQQIVDVRPFVALDGQWRLEDRRAIQTHARQDARDGGPRNAQRHTDLPRGRLCVPQGDDRAFAPPDRADVDPQRGGNPRIGPW